MASSGESQAPLFKRLYDRIWLLAALALAFWALSYVVWGFADVFSVPVG